MTGGYARNDIASEFIFRKCTLKQNGAIMTPPLCPFPYCFTYAIPPLFPAPFPLLLPISFRTSPPCHSPFFMSFRTSPSCHSERSRGISTSQAESKAWRRDSSAALGMTGGYARNDIASEFIFRKCTLKQNGAIMTPPLCPFPYCFTYAIPLLLYLCHSPTALPVPFPHYSPLHSPYYSPAIPIPHHAIPHYSPYHPPYYSPAIPIPHHVIPHYSPCHSERSRGISPPV